MPSKIDKSSDQANVSGIITPYIEDQSELDSSHVLKRERVHSNDVLTPLEELAEDAAGLGKD